MLLAQSKNNNGFTINLPISNSEGLPAVGSFIYIEWDESTSEEPAGWYHSQVIQYQADGCAMLKYNEVTTEVIDLKQAKWKFTRKNGKLYLPLHKNPPSFPLKKVKESSARKKYFLSDPQCVKAYADDLTIISNHKDAHQDILSIWDEASLSREIKPEKSISYCFDGQKTRNISTGPTKFLGETIGLTLHQSRKAATVKLTKKVYDVLDKINARPIRGEYKVWIYKSYLAPSTQFHLAVDRISLNAIKKIQCRITSLLKQWLRIPKCATLASLFHPESMNLPYLPHLLEKCKLRLLSIPSLSIDHNISSLTSLVRDPSFLDAEMVPSNISKIITTNDPPSKSSDLRSLLKTLKDQHVLQ